MAVDVLDFKYRPDVDGLRAVAVILVLLYHAGLGFSGGFVGVDVFFVISGFLITRLVLKQLDAGTFSLSVFWVRRIRRIVPAAWVLVAAVLVAGYFLLLPDDFEGLGASAFAQQLMLANVYFWRNTGYFDGPAELKPLLHTWSLAVEEQFYLGYPFLLVALHRGGRRFTCGVLAAIALGSLILSEYGIRNYPSASFFLLPSRMWELLAGALICFLPSPKRFTGKSIAICSWISLCLIIGSGWFYTPGMPFPGISATIPCGAAAILIYLNAGKRSIPAVMLAARPMVFVGLISYSLYLWHWPILAFWHYWIGDDVGFVAGVALLAISFGFAVLSWKYVETPLRKGESIGTGRTFVAGLLSVTVLASLSFGVKHNDGYPDRLPDSVVAASKPIDACFGLSVEKNDIETGKLPRIGVFEGGEMPIDFIVWGDSHGRALYECLDELAKMRNLSGVLATRPATPPILNVWLPGDKLEGGVDAASWNDAMLRFVRRNRIRNVILVGRWAVYIEGRPNGDIDTLMAARGTTVQAREAAALAFQNGLQVTLNELEALGANVWVLKQVPLQEFNPQRAIVRSLYFGLAVPKGVPAQQHVKRQANANRILDSLVASRRGVKAIDLSERFFDSDGFSQIGDANGSFYRDSDHVSARGSRLLIRPTLEPVFDELAANCAREN